MILTVSESRRRRDVIVRQKGRIKVDENAVFSSPLLGDIKFCNNNN